MKRVPLGEFMPTQVPSLNPANFPDEEFELWSIPAFDSGEPERLAGLEIGSSKKCVEPEDVLLSRIVPHIRRSWVVGQKGGSRQIASGEWIIFRSSKFFPPYLRHVLISDDFHARFMQTVAGVGGSLLRARPEGVKEIEIPLPPLEEQKRIAAILDQADSLRRLRQRAIDRLTTLGKALFNNIFRANKSAEAVTLDLFSDIQIGYPFKSSQYTDSEAGIRLCRGANVLPSRIDWSDIALWPLSKIANLEEFSLQEGDTVIAMDRPWISTGFKVAQVSAEDIPSLLVQRVARVRPKQSVHKNYIFFSINSPEFEKFCCPTETTIPHISPKEVRNFPIQIPDSKKCEEFENEIKVVSFLLEAAMTEKQEMDRLFYSLQHRAFRGEL